MHAGDDDYLFGNEAIEDPIRKALEKNPPCGSVNHRMRHWVSFDCVQGGSHRGEEFVAEPSALTLVPPVRHLNVRGGGRPKDDFHSGLRIFRTTSSHGMPLGPSCSKSSSRRSSSAR